MTKELTVVTIRFTENRGRGKVEYVYHSPEDYLLAYKDNCLAMDSLVTKAEAQALLSEKDKEIEELKAEVLRLEEQSLALKIRGQVFLPDPRDQIKYAATQAGYFATGGEVKLFNKGDLVYIKETK